VGGLRRFSCPETELTKRFQKRPGDPLGGALSEREPHSQAPRRPDPGRLFHSPQRTERRGRVSYARQRSVGAWKNVSPHKRFVPTTTRLIPRCLRHPQNIVAVFARRRSEVVQFTSFGNLAQPITPSSFSVQLATIPCGKKKTRPHAIDDETL
jgi:hypothetical protein